ncbi:MAG: aminotransferase [Paracoccaceae bacterium]|nr:MAG: aminotransferase [Paracoccaceae bacterium]
MAIGTIIRTFHNGRWHEGNAPILGAADHGAWQGTMVFDGARAFEGVTPDLDRHCARLIESARVMGLNTTLTAEEIAAIAREGLRGFAPQAAVYIRPMMWSRESGPGIVPPDPDSTDFALCLEDLPMPEPRGLSLTVSPYLRPHPLAAMTEAKCAALYANNGRIIREALARGFDNALSRDHEGNVAETASTNVFMVRDGEVFTPAPNGTFLNGITRQRVIGLLRADGFTVHETTLTVKDFHQAEEIFTTGNAAKVMPVTRFEDHRLQFGPVARRARALYWEFAHSGGGAR